MKFLIIYITFSTILIAQNQDKSQINLLLDQWHKAASNGDEKVFFEESMATDAIYIGTDASELWTRVEFEKWSQKYFERESAWDFKPYNRHIYFSKNKKVAWFDELLYTWMGSCRGSGVLEKHKGKWQLKHYHLAIAVPNEIVEEYLEILHTKN